MRTLIEFLKSKLFLRHIILAFILFVASFFILDAWIDGYTRHGEYVSVPDLSSFSLEEVEEELTILDLSFEVIDSGMYNPQFPRGSVVSQIPESYGEVKKGRTIYLTINPRKTRKIPIPDIIDKSKRQGVSYLESVGFKIGDLEYVPDVAKEVVLEMKVDGKAVQIGEMFPRGTRIDLVLGMGLSDEKVQIPWLMGLNVEESKAYLRTFGLNMGALSWDEEIEDSSSAMIYKQYPPPSLRKLIQLGGSVDLWITSDETRIPADTVYSDRNIDTSRVQLMDTDTL